MSINDHSKRAKLLPHPSLPVQAIVHFLHFLLMNYGLKIGTAIFPTLPIYHCSSFFWLGFRCLLVVLFQVTVAIAI